MDDAANGAVTDGGGAVQIASVFAGTMNLDGSSLTADGGTDVLLTAIDPTTGRFAHVTRLDTSGSDDGSDVALGVGSEIVVGLSFSGRLTGVIPEIAASDRDAAIVRLRTDHTNIRAASFPASGNQTLWRIATTPSGDTVLALTTDGETDLGTGPVGGAGGTDALLVIVGSDDSVRMVHELASGGNEEVTDLAVDSAGNIYLSARVAGPGELLIDGHPLTISGTRDAVLASFDSDGQIRFARAYGATGENNEALGIVVDEAARALYFVGDASGMTVEGFPVPADGSRRGFLVRFGL